jgi:hypothetical protein
MRAEVNLSKNITINNEIFEIFTYIINLQYGDKKTLRTGFEIIDKNDNSYYVPLKVPDKILKQIAEKGIFETDWDYTILNIDNGKEIVIYDKDGINIYITYKGKDKEFKDYINEKMKIIAQNFDYIKTIYYDSLKEIKQTVINMFDSILIEDIKYIDTDYL